MFIHKLTLGLTLILIVYISAVPVLIDDTHKDSKKKARIARSLTKTRIPSTPKEPWEINENLAIVKGR